MKTCTNCHKSIDENDTANRQWFRLYSSDLDIEEYLCTASCLNEYAWRIRETQPKLSKSRSS